MAIFDAVIGPVAKLLDKIIPDPQARDRAKLELLKLEGDQEAAAIRPIGIAHRISVYMT